MSQPASLDKLSATKLDTKSVSYSAVNHKEDTLCELFITRAYSKSSCYGSSFECGISPDITLCGWLSSKHQLTKMSENSQSNLQSSVTACLRCAAECTLSRNLSHIRCIHRQMYQHVFSLTQTNKGQRTHLANSVYRKRTRKNFCTESEWERISVITLCGVSVSGLTNNENLANSTCSWHRKHLKWYYCNKVYANIRQYPKDLRVLAFRIYSILRVQLDLSPLSGMWHWTGNSSRAGTSCHVKIRADDKAATEH